MLESSDAYVPGGASGYVIKGAAYPEPVPPRRARLAAAANAAEVMWKKTLGSLQESQIRSNSMDLARGVGGADGGADGASAAGTGGLVFKAHRPQAGWGTGGAGAEPLPGLREEEGKWREQLHGEQREELHKNAEVMRERESCVFTTYCSEPTLSS